MARIIPAADRLVRLGMSTRGFESRFIDVGPMRVHLYDGRGKGALPPIVLIHGLGATGSSFARVGARLLPQVKRVVIPELIGHGRSAHPGHERVTPDLLIQTMMTALERVVDEPAIVCGNSLGGAVALAFAIRHPERVRGLVLVSPAGARLPNDEWSRLVASFRVEDRQAARALLTRIYHRPPWFLALVAHEFPDLLRQRAVRDLLETTTEHDAATAEQLAKLEMPVLLLWGKSDRLLPAAALRYFERHLPPHARVEKPERFGHAPQVEAPARFADRILAFACDTVAAQVSRATAAIAHTSGGGRV